jgi:ABC transporter with metal-binding/Fe-S-binding domain ATP-binding protein
MISNKIGAGQDIFLMQNVISICLQLQVGVLAMRVAVLYSGGKDSNLAAYRASKSGHDIVALITAVPFKQDSWMFHHPNVEHALVQAQCMGVGWERLPVSGEKEVEVKELQQKIALLKGKLALDAICTGAIASRYQRERVATLCSELGLAEFSPLWGEQEESLLKELLSLGFEVYFSSVSAEGLGREWLGSRLDKERIKSLLGLNRRYGINVSGEGGEYETFVADAPFFTRRIEIIGATKEYANYRGVYRITEARLVEK